MSIYDKYELVVGLEVHVQLSTQTKAYSSDDASYGGAPNTHIHPITLGHPGTLPRVNNQQVEYAVRLGHALGCSIRLDNQFARKNYFYADLPKGYQITQDKTPICTGGYVDIQVDDTPKRIGLTRIHMEEDAGKSTHDLDPYYSLIDLNRAGVPLLEIVSEPDFRSADEAYAYLKYLQRLVRYLDICDGNMEEGSMRCDCNVSVRLKGSDTFGTRREVKNINSFNNVKRAIHFEFKDQIETLERGGVIEQETRNFEAASGTTTTLRSKEDAHDYRYFPEPDMPPVMLTEAYLQQIKESLPPLPQALFARFTEEFGLSAYDANILSDDKETAFYYLALLDVYKGDPKTAANWLINTVKAHLNEQAQELSDFKITPTALAQLMQLVDAGKVSLLSAKQNIFKALVEDPTQAPLALAESMNLIQNSNVDELATYVDEVLAQFPDKVAAYRNGKKGLMGMFIGQIMRKTQGKADPKMLNSILQEKLEA